MVEAWFQASDGFNLFTRTWAPEETALGVLHIHHGLGEHSARYQEFAEKLAQEGFVVIAHDARLHGKTATQAGAPGLGVVDAAEKNIVHRMVKDMSELLEKSRVERPGLPIVLFGHSFGTVVSQICAGTGSSGPLAAIVLCSPPSRIPKAMAPATKALLRLLLLTHGKQGTSKLVNMLVFDKFQKNCVAMEKLKGPKNGWEWLNRDPTEVQKYIEDPWCGGDFCIGYFSAAVPEIVALGHAKAHRGYPDQVPICVLIGERDACAVNDFGTRSDQSIRKELSSAGRAPPEVFTYPGCRHELLLELNRQEVISDVIAFCKKGISATPSAPKNPSVRPTPAWS